MAPILKYCLPAMGICRNFPRALVFSSPTYFGLGFQHLHTMQEIAHIKDIIWHTYAGTLTGILYCTSLKLFLIEVGVGTDLLDIPWKVLPLATQSLIQDTVIFSQTHKLDLRHDISMLPSREEDQLIMLALLPLSLSTADLKACNHCRMYLRALFLSDLVSGDGLMILDSAWNGDRTEDFRASSWPNYGKPPRSAWDIWRRYVSKAFLGRGRRLRTPLGRWLTPDTTWSWYLNVEGSLFQCKEKRWSHYPSLL
jgi:hypothetical protein